MVSGIRTKKNFYAIFLHSDVKIIEIFRDLFISTCIWSNEIGIDETIFISN